MSKTRLMNRPEDYKKLGVNPDAVEPREDGRRDDSRPGAYEWWYFDAVLDDGTKVVIYYGDKNLDQAMLQGPFPYCELQVTLPDGTYHHDYLPYEQSEGSFAKDHCDVKIGPHRLVGDLREYQVLVSPVNGWGVDLKMTNIGTSWRPGSGYFAFGDNDENYFTWLCAVPRGRVEGTLTVNGEAKKVAGYAYHDHQWGDAYPSLIWNHWVWARQNFGDHNILLFDFNAAPAYNADRYTICFVQDNEGKTLFEHYNAAQREILEEYVQEGTGKDHPKKLRYTMESGGKKLVYTLYGKKELEMRDDTKRLDDQMRALMDSMGLYPTYTRFFGPGELCMTEGGKEMKLSGELIYEFVYSGKTYKI